MVPTYNIYVDLDSMFDVKYVILEKYFPKLAELVIKDKSYFFRTTDQFMHKDFPFKVSSSHFMTLYNSRTKFDLGKAKPTSIMILIAAAFNNFLDSSQNGDDLKDIKFIINTYPYKLKENEQMNICLFMRQFFRRHLEFDFYYLPIQYIDSKWILENEIEIMVIHDFLNWIEITDKKILFSHLVDNVRVMTPKIINFKGGEICDKDSLNDDVWSEFEKTSKMFLDMEFVESFNYSPFELYHADIQNETKKEADNTQ